MDGLNNGLEFFVENDENLELFKANQAFQYFSAFEPTTGNMNPSGFELPVGDYYLAFRNITNERKLVALEITRFASRQDTPPPSSPPPSSPPTVIGADEGGGSTGVMIILLLGLIMAFRTHRNMK